LEFVLLLVATGFLSIAAEARISSGIGCAANADTTFEAGSPPLRHAKLAQCPSPIYPDSARTNCICGRVLACCHVRRDVPIPIRRSPPILGDGAIRHLEIIAAEPPGIFDGPTRHALSKARFYLSPAAEGDTTDAATLVSITFALDGIPHWRGCRCGPDHYVEAADSISVLAGGDVIQ
jgi:hypothetical protein